MSPEEEALISRSQRAEAISAGLRTRTLERLRNDDDVVVDDPLGMLIEHARSGS